MKKVILFLTTVSLTFLFIELFLNVSEVSSPSVTKNDDTLGSALKGNANLIFFNEGFYIGKVNKFGYYGPAYSPIKPKGTLRIALVGDSYVESHQLFDRKSFRAIMEKELKEKLKKNIQVLNFGMSGFNLNDDYCYYVNFVKKYNPDYTLYFVSNEDFDSARTSLRRPYCEIINDSLKINYSFRYLPDYIYRKKTAWFRGKSILLGWMFQAKNLIKKGYAPRILFDKFYMDNKTKEENISQSLEPEIKAVNFGKVTRKIIEELKKEKGVYFVTKEPLKEKFIKSIKPKYFPIEKVSKLEYHFWKVTGKYGHWNADGHLEVGKQIADFIYKNETQAIK